MEKPTDLRVVKTQKHIKEAFYELVSEKDFDKITVSDIANRALINRATFYLHYQDKYDLLEKIENEVIDQIEAIITEIEIDRLHEHMREGMQLPHVSKILHYVQENTIFFEFIASNNIDPSFFHKMGELMNKTVFEIAKLESKKTDAIYNKYIPNINSAIFISIVSQWIKTGMKESVHEISMLLSKLAWSSLNMVLQEL